MTFIERMARINYQNMTNDEVRVDLLYRAARIERIELYLITKMLVAFTGGIAVGLIASGLL